MHVEPPPIPLIKIKNNAKSNKDCVKTKLRRDPTSENLDLYEFKMALFGNGEPEEFLLFVQKFQLTLKAPVTIDASTKMQYFCTLLHEEALRQLEILYFEVGSTTVAHLNHIIFGLGTYFFPVNALPKQKCTM